MKKKRPPVAVVLEPSVAELYSSLREEDKFKNSIDRALDVLKEDMFSGERVRKRQIPAYYVKRFGVNNLYVLKLDRAWRLCYTLIADEEGVKVAVFEVFSNHKAYDRRFGYKTR